MVLGKNILKALFLKGTSNVPGEKKKYSTFELQGVAGEILLSKTENGALSSVSGGRKRWSQVEINLKCGWRKMQKISKVLHPYHKIAEEKRTRGRKFS